jgi:hypothetical protein
MFVLTTKVKVAAGIAAGVLTLGSAGAYAAANANNTVAVQGSTTLTATGPNANGATLMLATVSQSPKAFPTTPFTNQGQCIAWFASNRDYAPATTASRVSKNYHGKLLSTIKSFCASDATTTPKSDAADTETQDTTQSGALSTNSTDLQSGASHGNGHGRP